MQLCTAQSWLGSSATKTELCKYLWHLLLSAGIQPYVMLLSSVCSNRISNWSSNLYPARSSPSACSRPVVAAAATATLCQSAADIKQLQLVTDSASHAGSLYCPSADDPTSPVTTGHHLLAAVAGAAAVATAGAELQTEALPVHFISDSSNISITACAAAFNNSNTPRSSKSNINSKVSRLSVKESRLLTRRISNSGSLQELLQLHTAQGQQFNIIHVSAVLSKVGKLLRDDPAAVPAVADGQQQLQQMLHQLEKLSLQLMADVQVSSSPNASPDIYFQAICHVEPWFRCDLSAVSMIWAVAKSCVGQTICDWQSGRACTAFTTALCVALLCQSRGSLHTLKSV